MTSSQVGQLVAAILLVPVSGLFAAADAALSTVSRARTEALLREGRTGARALAAVVADRPRHLNLILLLRLTAEAVATVLGTYLALQFIAVDALAVTVAAVVVAVVSYVLIGVGPRTIGRQHPSAVGLVVAGPVRALARLLGPLASLLILVGNAITPGKGFREGPFASEVELREMVDMAEARGVVDGGERAMIQSVFELGDTIVREVMVPRTEMIWIEREKSVRQALALALRSGYSRIPVIGENVDDAVGVVYLKDLVRRTTMHTDGRADGPGPLVEVMRPAAFVPDSKRADALLRDMQRNRNHMALVVDEYGGTAGLVTIEDILEEIVGEITDEYDTAENVPIDRLDATTLRVSARLPVEDLEQETGAELRTDDVETVGGLLAQRLGRVPLPGSEAEVGGLRLRAEGGEDSRGRTRVTTLLVRLPERADDDAASPDGHAAPEGTDHDSDQATRGREPVGARSEGNDDHD